MRTITVEIPRVRYLCGLEESWDQPMYVYPLREEDSGWTAMSRVSRPSAPKARSVRRSGPSAVVTNELRTLTQ
jgi:hypothetical protein